MKYAAVYLKSPQYVAGSKVWSGGMTRSRKRGVSVSEDMAARSHGSPNSPASTSRRPQSAAPPLPLLSPAMNFGLWHISCSKTANRKCLLRLLPPGIWLHVICHKCNNDSDGNAASIFMTFQLWALKQHVRYKLWYASTWRHIPNTVILIYKPVCFQCFVQSVLWQTSIQSVLLQNDIKHYILYSKRMIQ